jgi:hypothetical protein
MVNTREDDMREAGLPVRALWMLKKHHPWLLPAMNPLRGTE